MLYSLPISSFATNTRSARATTETTDVSLMRKMTLATSAGKHADTACGTTTWRIAAPGLIPSETADSHWMRSTDSRPERKASAMYPPPMKASPITALASWESRISTLGRP